jgi:hypothetical protein
VEGFNFDLGAGRATHLSAAMLSHHRHNQKHIFSDLPLVEALGIAPSPWLFQSHAST